MSGLGQQFIGNPYLGEFGQAAETRGLSTGSGKAGPSDEKTAGI